MDLMDKDLLRRALGKVLERAEALVYVDTQNLEDTDHPMSLSFEFADGVTFRMYGHSDGERLRLDSSTREPFDMQELGRVILRDMSDTPKMKELIGRRLVAVRAVVFSEHTSVDGNILGIRFEFEPPERLFVLNWGDTTFIGRDLPADAVRFPVTEFPMPQ